MRLACCNMYRMLWIAAAAQLSAPLPVGHQSWWSPDDMPAYVQLEGVDRTVPLRLVVKPDGKLQGCEIETGSGDAKLDQYTCVVALRRAKYTPARWIDGTPSYGAHRMPVTWAIGSPPLKSSIRGDVELTVSTLPQRIKSPAFVGVIFAADEAGHPLSCTATPTEWQADPRSLALVPLACDELMKRYTAMPVRDEGGKAVRSVQNAVIRFSIQKP
jgi:hypothetical protein